MSNPISITEAVEAAADMIAAAMPVFLDLAQKGATSASLAPWLDDLSSAFTGVENDANAAAEGPEK